MTRTITYSQSLETTTCWCGINLAVPSNLLRHAHDGEQDIYCPIGHKFGWHETEADRLRKQLERARANVTHERDQRQAAERSKAALKGQLTKARKRAKNGVCPCCNRSFPDMADHIATKHPDFNPTT